MLKDREVPEFKPEFEKFKREDLDKAPPPTEEDFRRIEEWNAQVRIERAQKVRRVASVAACAVLAIAVVGGAIWMNRDSAVVPNGESSVASSDVSDVGDISEEDAESALASDTSASEWPELENGVVSYEQAVQLTGLPLVKADEMDGFVGYQIGMDLERIVSIDYWFENGIVHVYSSSVNAPSLSDAQSIKFADKTFFIQEDVVSNVGSRVTVRYNALDDAVFVGRFTNTSVEEAVQMLNALVF